MGFTLTELLVVISIIGILAALSVPALKNLGKSNVRVSATRQMLDDVARARQLAISQHTTVYMMFVPQNFWYPVWYNAASASFTPDWNKLSPAEKNAATNLLDKQFSGYTFVSLRSIGDQPGQGQSRYIGEWRSLPDGAFIVSNKFNAVFRYNSLAAHNGGFYAYDAIKGITYDVNSFNYTNLFPFPVETNFNASIYLPFIAFNYLGQLTTDGITLANRDEYIPLAEGTVAYAVDANKALVFGQADFTENPPGNSTNSMFRIIRIDRLTGRATLLEQKLQ